MLRVSRDIVKSTYRWIDGLEFTKQDNQHTAQFEIGFLMFILFEKYRMMVDKYNTSHTLRTKLYTMELVMYLEDIENHYWEVEHVVNMLHEIERKFGVESSLYSTFIEMSSHEKRAAGLKVENPKPDTLDFYKKKKKRKPFIVDRYLKERMNPPKSTTRKRIWPLDYGWEFNF
uniref:Uncharacterized protein n=1 Tax=Heliothis virescens TaxID=7102 RepID=A0A2A4J7B5_HELVI